MTWMSVISQPLKLKENQKSGQIQINWNGWVPVLNIYSPLNWTALPAGNLLVQARACLPLQLLSRFSMSAVTKAAPRQHHWRGLCSMRRIASGGLFCAQAPDLTAQK